MCVATSFYQRPASHVFFFSILRKLLYLIFFFSPYFYFVNRSIIVPYPTTSRSGCPTLIKYKSSPRLLDFCTGTDCCSLDLYMICVLLLLLALRFLFPNLTSICKANWVFSRSRIFVFILIWIVDPTTYYTLLIKSISRKRKLPATGASFFERYISSTVFGF